MGSRRRTARFPEGLWAFRAEPYLLGVLGLWMVVLAFLFPPTGDDLAWGSREGMNRLEDRFAGYNGRWLGNLVVLFLTHVTWVTPFVLAATVCLLMALLVRLARFRTLGGYTTAIALFLLMPLPMWRQTIAWVSGFANYATASVCLLLFLLSVQRDWTGEWRRPRLAAAVAVPVAFASALFIEHVTLVLVLGGALNLALLARRGRPKVVALGWLVGAVAGAALMFSNSAYRAVADGTSGYQSSDTGLMAIIKTGTGGVSQYAVAMNLALNVTIVAALAGLAGVARLRAGGWSVRLVLPPAVGLVGLAVGSWIVSTMGPMSAFSAHTSWSWVSSLGLLLALTTGAFFLIEDKEARLTILLLTATAVMLVAPSAVMRPYGPRNFLPPYLLLVVVALILVRAFFLALPEDSSRRILGHGVAGLGLALSVSTLATFTGVYVEIHQAQDERVQLMRDAVREGKRTVSVWELPDRGYVHHPDPLSTWDMRRFKRYHHLPRRLTITFVKR